MKTFNALLGWGFNKKPVFCGSGSGSSSSNSDNGSSSNDNDNTFSETLANIFTPNDGASYVNGNLVDDATGETIEAGGTTSTGNVISGSANDPSNDRPAPSSSDDDDRPVTATTAIEETGALPSASATRPDPEPVEETSGNSAFENLANVFTPFDGAAYVNGVLVDEKTGEKLDAGDTTYSGNVISGSANDPSNDDNELPASFTNALPNLIVNPNIEAGVYDESQLDDEWGYTRPDGTVVSASIDMIDGGGKNFGGEMFGSSGGINADLNGDGYITNEEAYATGGINDNLISTISTASGATPLGSGIDPTGVAGAVYNYTPAGMLYGGVKDMTDNFGFERPETSIGTDLDDITGSLDLTDAINATVNSVVLDPNAVDYPTGTDDDTTVDTTVPAGALVFPDDPDTFSPLRTDMYGTRDITQDFQRRYKGGGMGFYAPEYLRRYASGQSIDELVRRVVLPDGTEAYMTPDGRYLDMDQFQGTALAGDTTSVVTGQEDYLTGYTETDAAGNIMEYDAQGNPIG
tara:strand:- start:322 stop:1884 length:1563 start_codon:yes stop_codon:yes gene_type:complete